MLKLIVLTQMVVTKAANKNASTMVPNTSFAFYTHCSLKLLLEYCCISGMSYLYYHKSLLPFLLFTCNAQEQAWEAKHLRPWQTHASQKSQIAPTIAIPNEYGTECENPDHMKTLQLKNFMLPWLPFLTCRILTCMFYNTVSGLQHAFLFSTFRALR